MAAVRWLFASEVADQLHVSPKTIARYARLGKIPHTITPGGHRRYDPRVIQEIADGLATEAELRDNGTSTTTGKESHG